MASSKSKAIVYIDGYAWSSLKADKNIVAMLSPGKTRKILRNEKMTFERYHRRMKQWIKTSGGRLWQVIGDHAVALFQSVDDAVYAAQAIQRKMGDFNTRESLMDAPLYLRIGVATGDLPESPKKSRGEVSTRGLDEAGHLEKDCPPGRIRISKLVFDALKFGKQDFRPGLSKTEKSHSKESYVWVEKMISPRESRLREPLTDKQKQCLPTVIMHNDPARRKPLEKSFFHTGEILKDAFVVVGETRDEAGILAEASAASDAGSQKNNARRPSPVAHAASTSDAVGVFEILSALEASPMVSGGVDEWVDSIDMASKANLLIVGSPSVNLFAYAFNEILPAGFLHYPDDPLRIRIGYGDQPMTFPERSHHASMDRNFGIALLSRNPVNPEHYMIWVAGISGMATQAAARFVRDCVANPTSTMDRLRKNGPQGPDIVVVRPAVRPGYSIEDYRGILRVNDYSVVWSGSQAELPHGKPTELTPYSSRRPGGGR